MKSHATRSNLACISNNLGWVRDVAGSSALPADGCPNRDSILKGCDHDPAIKSILCDCEKACVDMRDAFNRRDLGVLVKSAGERKICLEKLRDALGRFSNNPAFRQMQAA